MLVSLQSHAEVLHTLDSAPALDPSDPSTLSGTGCVHVASVSPQSRASIAAAYGVSEREAGHMIEQLLSGPSGLRAGGQYNNGMEWVVDTNVAREACLVVGAEEVLQSLQTEKAAGSPAKPILTSSCPGWICYAEKTHPHVLPHLSRLKSPQALMGTLIKTALRQKLGIPTSQIWHVAIMPCFDKKLEASREELTDEAWDHKGQKGIRDVDCVITTKELLMLADSRGIDFGALPRVPVANSTPFPDTKLQQFLFPPRRRKNGSPSSGTSGGNLSYLLQSIAAQHEASRIDVVRGRNADVIEYSVVSASGESLFKAARYYGFRNIQNLVRRLKPARASRIPGGRPIGGARKPNGKSATPEYAYVEVMACPGGCTNGGGQIKADDAVISQQSNGVVSRGPLEQKQWLTQVDEAYFSGGEDSVEFDEMDVDGPNDIVDGISTSYIEDALSYWSYMTGIDLGTLVYTSYREVVSDVGKKVSETERVVQLAGKIGGGW